MGIRMGRRAQDLLTISGMGMTRVVLLLLIWVSILLSPMVAQSDFLSIDCGSLVTYTDSITGVKWSTDDGYIRAGLGINQPVSAQLNLSNSKEVTTARYFKPGRRRNCYALPVTYNSSYMIRATFLYGDIDGGSPPADYEFQLSIDSTIVATVTIEPSAVNTILDYEFFVASTGANISFCVIPVVGTAFISALELRPLKSTMYNGLMFSSKYSKTLYRLNCGAAPSDPLVRYPDDLYDRKWKAPGPEYEIGSISTNVSLGPVQSVIFDNPPVKAMQDGWTKREISFNLPFTSETTSRYYITLYFAEIGSPNATDRRSVDIYINDKPWFKAYNVTKAVDEVYSDDALFTIGSANFILSRASGSTLDPILNAIEVHAIYGTVTTTTLSSDVTALLSVQRSLSLLDWTGDPCLPISWDWLNCSYNSVPRVTQVKLSGVAVEGTLPSSLNSLTALTDLWLDSNFISGSIPDLSGLFFLKTLHLQNNSLTGPIPVSLADIPNLSELFLENNKFSSSVPAALQNKAGLTITADSFSTSDSSSSEKSSSSGAVIGGIVGGVVVVVALLLFAVFFCVRRSKKGKTEPQSEITGSHTGASKLSSVSDPTSQAMTAGHGNHHLNFTRAFSNADVVKATDNFKKKIGEGGFGPVYYGKHATGEEVAVKVNSTESGQGSVEFSTEVSLLSRVHHRNLVSLVGFCDEDDQQILIYDYMQNGTLRDQLYGRGLTRKLDWRTRLDIAVNAARGLEYLHYDCSPKIIHRDVKSNNILLNEKMLAKVADFGISKLAPDEETTAGVSTVVRGTTGYLDPEYFSSNKLTQKSDVYAFGVVLLEIIAGRAPNNNRLDDPLQWNLVEYSRGMLRDGNLEGIVDPSLKGSYDVEAMWKLAELAMFCVEPHSANRPDMRQVVRELVEATDLEHRKDSSPTTTTSNATMSFTSLLEDNTQTSHPSTQSSVPAASPRVQVPSSAGSLQQPKAR